MEIRPLRGYRYAGDTARDISTVVAPPYDQISAAIQGRLYALSPHNIVRVTYPREAADKYRGARGELDAWLAAGVWRRDERPAIYPYHQTYSADGHHRYETAAAYAGRHPGAAYKLMAFFALEAPGLTILPNHRLVRGVPTFDFDDLVQTAARWFDVAPLADPLAARLENRTIGVV